MYRLGAQSLLKLSGVHPDMVRVVKHAIKITEADFSVHEGLRSIKRQIALKESGASKTLNSRHLTGHAVDLVGYVAGSKSWDWPLIYKIGDAMRTAAIEEGVTITWGGVWDIHLNDLPGELEHEVAEYIMRCKAAGKKAFPDGAHFELSWKYYPKKT